MAKNDFIAYAVGLVSMSVCTSLEDTKEIERRANAWHPTGISSRWEIADEPFGTGEPNPCPCNIASDRKHYLLHC